MDERVCHSCSDSSFSPTVHTLTLVGEEDKRKGNCSSPPCRCQNDGSKIKFILKSENEKGIKLEHSCLKLEKKPMTIRDGT